MLTDIFRVLNMISIGVMGGGGGGGGVKVDPVGATGNLLANKRPIRHCDRKRHK